MTNPDLISRIIKSALLLIVATSGPVAKAQTDSLSLILNGSSITSAKRTSHFYGKSGKEFVWNLSGSEAPVSISGYADPIHAATMIPGVSTGIDLDCGLHVNGNDSQHSLVSVDGVPLYGSGHLFGFFPIFNMTRHSTMTISPVAENVNRLGGSLDIALDKELPSKSSLLCNFGTIAVDASGAVRIGKKSAILASGRHSFLNSLYNKKLCIEDMPVEYLMDDINLSVVIRPDESNLIWTDAFFSCDALSMDNCLMENGNLSSGWKNGFVSMHWQCSSTGWSMSHMAYFSGFSSRITIDAIDLSLVLPSSFSTVGYNGKIWSGNLFAGLDLEFHNARIQTPLAEGLDNAAYVVDSPEQGAAETRLSSGYKLPVGQHITADICADVNFYCMSGEKPDFSVDTATDFRCELHRAGILSARMFLKSQFLFKNGLSNIGLPLEFWHLAGGNRKPQRALGTNISHKLSFNEDSMSLASDIFFSKLFNQIEYTGTVNDLISESYRLEDHLLQGDGMNYGLNLRLEKLAGRMTGWVGASLGRSLRRFDSVHFNGWYPSNHERIFEFNATAAYDFGTVHPAAAFVWATGTPFTAPDSFYILSGHVISHYSNHNSCRLRPYSRLDVSCSIELKSGDRFKHSIDLAIYNVLCRKNDIFYNIRFAGSGIRYIPRRYFMTFIPSINYKCEF